MITPTSSSQRSSQAGTAHTPHILIIGAGITGLVLGQALKKHGIPFTIYERDHDVAARGRGWGLTIHWSLQTFFSLLPQNLIDRLPEAYVDPEASARGDNGNFLFFDLQSGEARWKVPPSERIRLSRERLRALLLDGLDVQWSKTLSSITQQPPNNNAADSDSITAHFTDSTAATGALLVGCDGTRSFTRSLLLQQQQQQQQQTPSSSSLAHTHAHDNNDNHALPVRLLGASVIYPTALASKLRALDPFFFQGGDPATDTFMYYSFLDTPTNNTRARGKAADKETYECQIILSWPFRHGFRGQEEPLEVPPEGRERVRLMKRLVEGWAEPFRECVMNIPEETDVKTIKLEDWLPKKGLWGNLGGKATLVGDAAHAMTMYRGEAANHGITDVSVLLSKILPILAPSTVKHADGPAPLPSMAAAIDAYEEEMIQRTGPAVLTSRRACLDAHEYARINDQSPLVSKRVKITEE